MALVTMGKDKLVYAITAGKFVPDAATTDFSLVSFAYFCTSLLVTVPLSVSTPAEVFRLTQDAALAESWAMNAMGRLMPPLYFPAYVAIFGLICYNRYADYFTQR